MLKELVNTNNYNTIITTPSLYPVRLRLEHNLNILKQTELPIYPLKRRIQYYSRASGAISK